MICHCITQYYKDSQSDNKQIQIGGDDLLPLFAYVVIRSGVPNLYSEYQYMQDFVAGEGGCLSGESGYFLVTFGTSLALILFLTLEVLDSWCPSDENDGDSESASLSHQSGSLPSFGSSSKADNLRRRPRTSSLIEVDLDSNPSSPVGKAQKKPQRQWERFSH